MSRYAALLGAREHLAEIRWMWPLLVAERVPGTPRPWLHTRPSHTQYRDPDDSGSHLINGVTAPVRLDVLDAMQSTHSWLRQAHAEAIEALGRTGHRSTVPENMLADLALWWEPIEDGHPALAEEIAEQVAHHHSSITHMLGLALDGKVLPFPCPYCQTGNALQVSALEDIGVAIVCTSGACSPPPQSSAHLWRDGRPAWRFAHWANLAAECERRGRYGSSTGTMP